MTNHMLISVHMPKAAGTSCLYLFEEIYGDKLLKDYDDKILHKSISIKKEGCASFFVKKQVEYFDVFKNRLYPWSFHAYEKYRLIFPERAFFLPGCGTLCSA